MCCLVEFGVGVFKIVCINVWEALSLLAISLSKKIRAVKFFKPFILSIVICRDSVSFTWIIKLPILCLITFFLVYLLSKIIYVFFIVYILSLCGSMFIIIGRSPRTKLIILSRWLLDWTPLQFNQLNVSNTVIMVIDIFYLSW